MNKLTITESLYVPCGNQLTHFKVKCDPDNEGNYMQCNVKKETNKYVLSKEELENSIEESEHFTQWMEEQAELQLENQY